MPLHDDMSTEARTSVADLVERLRSRTGGRQWRSLEDLADSPEFQQWLDDEFPHRGSLLSMDRRRFLQVMGASLALAGLAGCRYLPNRRAVPFVRAVEDQVPGKPLFYASAIVLAGYAEGVLVESHEGRPTKIEGNPRHPASLGATNALTQAALLDMYDPDRSRNILRSGEIATWNEFLDEFRPLLSEQRRKGGSGLRILSGAITSPSLTDQIQRLHQMFPQSRWYTWEPAQSASIPRASYEAAGQTVVPRYHFDQADVVVSLGADFLNSGPGHVRYARDFMSRRRPQDGAANMNRLYVAESMPSGTGAVADHRLPIRMSDLPALTLALAHRLGLPQVSGMSRPALARDEYTQQWLASCASDLKRHRGRAVVVADERLPAEVHVVVMAINDFLGANGQTVHYTAPVQASIADSFEGIRELGRDIADGKVEALLVLNANPVYDAPADVPFTDLLRKVPFTVHLGLRNDETGRLCKWHVPAAHDLESWGDHRSFDGTVTFQQPLIQPLFGGKTVPELVSVMLGRPADGYEILRAYWSRQFGAADGEVRFRRCIHDGFLEDSGFPSRDVRPQAAAVTKAAQTIAASKAASRQELELTFAPDPSVYDGRFANNGWLQELPKAISKLTWDNAVFVSPATAQKLGLRDGDVVALEAQGRKLDAPVRIQPGHARDSLTLHLGGGRWAAGNVGNGVGVNANVLRPIDRPWLIEGVEVVRTGARHRFAVTEDHHAIRGGRLDGQQGRDIVRTLTLSEFEGLGRKKAHNGHEEHPSLYDGKDHKYDGYAWGMVVDLSVCTGCNACVVACQAENNIPVVGKEQVARGREMHWIRIDRYYEGDPENPDIHHQPVMCMHCEMAPCEPVCPVAATVHSHEGLNQMVYNRCVGTRYCSNNCPYKVRRFNFLNYANHAEPRILQLLRNPDVTVRGRGVMEKCTFCVQRINAARIQAKKENREIRDGEILTACQQACPTKAITFGNIADQRSEVTRLKKAPHGYALLEELNTRPRLTYLARVRNPVGGQQSARAAEPTHEGGVA